ncbi:MAG: SIMPL domain-containing protein [Acetobacteraceae bacterium]
MRHAAARISRTLLPAGLAGMLLAVPVASAAADTLLSLSETATVMIAPDELAAVLRAESVNASAVEAQGKVNAAISEAVALARQTQGVTVSTSGYNVWRSGPTQQERTERWHASQTMNLTSADGTALLTLVGELQKRGLVIGNLAWRLSRETQRKAHQDATRQAISALRGRVDEAAALLGLRFDSFKEVRLDSSSQPTPMPRFAAQMASAAPAPPTAVAEDVPVSATAQADAILVAR